MKSFNAKREAFKKTLTVFDGKDDNLKGFGFCRTRRTLRVNANRNGGKRVYENGLRDRSVIEKRPVGRVLLDSGRDSFGTTVSAQVRVIGLWARASVMERAPWLSGRKVAEAYPIV